MHDIERQVWREARAMARREVITKAITKQLSWVQAAETLGISAQHMRRLRCKLGAGRAAPRDGADGKRDSRRFTRRTSTTTMREVEAPERD